MCAQTCVDRCTCVFVLVRRKAGAARRPRVFMLLIELIVIYYIYADAHDGHVTPSIKGASRGGWTACTPNKHPLNILRFGSRGHFGNGGLQAA